MKESKFLIGYVLVFLILATVAAAQTTEFTYQGRLLDNSMPPTSLYDFEFRLTDAETGGAVLGTQTRLGVAVANGVFTVRLDFGAQFDGAPRWLEIAVRPAGGGAFTGLAPRQPITSAPYSIRSANAGNAQLLGGISASGFIRNTTAQQTADFNISGDGAIGGDLSVGGAFGANILNAQTQYNYGGTRILSAAGNQNLFAGLNAGTANSTGFSNAFVGSGAGNVNGINNSFFGQAAGFQNTSGQDNTFVGNGAGLNNTSASQNTFVGSLSGQTNTTGNFNSFFGIQAGNANTTGNNNSFFGAGAGFSNVAGGNSFFGRNAGNANTTGTENAFFGFQAGGANLTGEQNSFFGYDAGSFNNSSNNAFFGYIAGRQTTTGCCNSFFGSFAGTANTTGQSNAFFGYFAGSSNTAGNNSFFGSQTGGSNTTGGNNSFFGSGAGSSNTTGENNTVVGAAANVASGNLSFATAIGAGAIVSQSDNVVLGRSADIVRVPGSLAAVGGVSTNGNLVALGNGTITGTLSVATLGAAGPTSLCRNASNQLASCSSSVRYKTDIQPFRSGLDLVKRLNPITFNWRDGGTRDVGFAAEEVGEIEPLLTFNNDKGEIEGVKYAQMTTVLVNAVNEQQQIIEKQQKQINALKTLVCELKPEAEICKEEK